MIINEGGLELLKGLSGTDDLKLKRAVCNAFANLCADGTRDERTYPNALFN